MATTGIATIVVGLVGGIASGKSHVASVWAESARGVILSADQMAHAALDEPSVQASLRERFGNIIFSTDTQINRVALANIVFANNADNDNLRFLESLIHPRVEAAMREQIATLLLAAQPQLRWVIVDAPLLLEAGLRSLVDRVVFVDTPDSVRRDRARARGWSDAELAQRESRQWSLADKRRAADVIIDGTLNATAISKIIASLPW